MLIYIYEEKKGTNQELPQKLQKVTPFCKEQRRHFSRGVPNPPPTVGPFLRPQQAPLEGRQDDEDKNVCHPGKSLKVFIIVIIIIMAFL